MNQNPSLPLHLQLELENFERTLRDNSDLAVDAATNLFADYLELKTHYEKLQRSHEGLLDRHAQLMQLHVNLTDCCKSLIQKFDGVVPDEKPATDIRDLL